MRLLAAIFVGFTACSHARIVDPCVEGAPPRRFGHTAVRERAEVTNAFVFVQGRLGAASASKDFFWAEKVAADALFGRYDIHVLATQTNARCGAAESFVREIRALVDRLDRYDRILFVTHDVRHAAAVDRSFAMLTEAQLRPIRGMFVFHTPATDQVVRRLPEGCAEVSQSAPEEQRRTVCSTFDDQRLAGVPVAAVCDAVLFARMSADMETASPCADVLYEIFREGLMSTAYETEHVLPRWTPPGD